MPTYSDPAAGVTYSEALLESAHVAPTDILIVECFEIYHPDGTPGGPLYFVNDTEDLVATKEADADRDAGLTVTFLAAAAPMQPLPESDDAAAPTSVMRLFNIAGVAHAALRVARGSQTPWVIISRLYARSDTTAPAQMPPLALMIETAEVGGIDADLGVGYGDPADVAIPVHRFRRIEYPTLQP